MPDKRTQGARAKIEPKTLRWPLPIRGVWQGINDTAIPLDGLFEASNITLRDGTVQGRPAINQLDAQVFDSRPTGALNIWTTAGLPRLVMGTLGKVWTFDYTTWSDRGGTLAGNADDPVRMTRFIFGTPAVTRAYICNNAVALQSWKDPDAALTAAGGSPPIFKDLATASDRLVGLVGTYGVQWGEPLVDDDWPAANIRFLSETDAKTIAIRAFGTLGLVVYKKDSIWLGAATGDAGALAFCFAIQGKFDGPAGPAAIADAQGTDYYMTQYGRIAKYTGSSHEWIADGVWSIIKAEIDQSAPGRVVGFYEPQNHEVWFTYPRVGDGGVNLGLVIVVLPRPEFGILHHAAFPGTFGKAISAAVKVDKESLKTAILFTSAGSAERSYTLDGTDDDGVAVQSNFQTGLQPLVDASVSRILNVEPFLERKSGNGTIIAKVATSNVLDKAEGNLTGGKIIDLTKIPVIENVGFDATGRFVALRYEFDDTDTVRYRGSVLRSMETT